MTCPACEAGVPTRTMSLGMIVPADPSTPKRTPDIVRKAPDGCVYAYLRERKQGQISYQVILLSMVQINYTLTGAPTHGVQLGGSEHLGEVVKRGTKFFPVMPDGSLRRKGASSLKKATYELYYRRGR